jgi:hypothetical protein
MSNSESPAVLSEAEPMIGTDGALERLSSLSAQVFHAILKDKGHPQRFAAAKEVLERNRLYASGVEPPQRGAFQPSVTVQTQVNLPEARVAEMSDADLEAYDRLLTELRELLPKDELKRIGSVSR